YCPLSVIALSFCFILLDPAPPAIPTLSLHDALPISVACAGVTCRAPRAPMTTASSASWCTFVLPGGMRIASAGPITEVDAIRIRSEEHTSELQSHLNLVCRLLLEKKKQKAH